MLRSMAPSEQGAKGEMAGMVVKAALGRLTPPLLMGSTAEPEATPTCAPEHRAAGHC